MPGGEVEKCCTASPPLQMTEMPRHDKAAKQGATGVGNTRAAMTSRWAVDKGSSFKASSTAVDKLIGPEGSACFGVSNFRKDFGFSFAGYEEVVYEVEEQGYSNPDTNEEIWQVVGLLRV